MRFPTTVPAAALLVGAAAFGSVSRPPHAHRPPAGHTGGFGEPTCLTCHIGAQLNDPSGRLEAEGLPESYEPGGRYVVTVVLESVEMGAAGFQLAARFTEGSARGEQAGRFEPVDHRVVVTRGPNGVAYVHQNQEGSVVSDPDVARWSFLWVAPTEGRPVTINVAANSANGDNSPLSDLIYTVEISVGPRG